MAIALGAPRGEFIRALTVLGLALLGFARSEALGQRLDARSGFYVLPASPIALGQQVTVGIRPDVAGTTYRYVATLRVTGAGRAAVSVGCAAPQNLGTGGRLSWTPASGLYRLTMYSLTRLKRRDSTSVSYQVNAPSGGWLNVRVTLLPNPSPPGQVTLQLSTNDRGAGHAYQWVVRFQSVLGALPMLDWSGASTGPTTSVPLILTPATYNVTARVGAHAGNPCQILDTSNGTLSGQVVR